MNLRYSILIDTREKQPLPFPAHLVMLGPRGRTVTVRLTTHYVTLETGDYLLQGSEGSTIIERKGSLAEVSQNCLTKDRKRFVRALGRLREACSRPILMLEGRPSDLYAKTPSPKMKPYPLAIDALMRMLAEHQVGLILLPTGSLPQRRAAGEWVARELINGSLVPAKTG